MMSVRALKVSGESIPVPPAPPKDDFWNPSLYINQELTDEQKKQLISSAEQFSDILELGGYSSNYYQAAKNVHHYRNGKGADMRLTAEEVGSISDLPTFKANKNIYLFQFLDDIARQFSSGDMTTACFVLEEKPGDHWLGAYARPDESTRWFYAIGGFLFSFGARADVVSVPTSEAGGSLRIKYKVYIYDRYNWDFGKTVELPKMAVDAADIATPGSIEPLKELAQIYPPQNYIETIEKEDGTSKYKISDSVMGSLAAVGKADFFDIRGETPEQSINYGLPPKRTGK